MSKKKQIVTGSPLKASDEFCDAKPGRTFKLTWRLTQGDGYGLLRKESSASVDLVCADPPWGIEWPGYADCEDILKDAAYVEWCAGWIGEIFRVLKETGSFWLAIGPEYVSELDVAAKSVGFIKRGQIVQYSTFGVACAKNFARSHSYWLYYTKSKSKFTFNSQDPELRVPSARQLKYNDSRANKSGKLPDAVWVLHPDELQRCFTGAEDVWLASRVAGTFKERVYRGEYGKSKTCPQMPLAVMDRIIRASSNPGDTVLDPMSGTGSTGTSALRLRRNFVGFELSKSYCLQIRERLRNAIHVGNTAPVKPVRRK